jgi:serine/threonine protein kinase
MRNDAAAVEGFNKQEPIPGYITKELIGAGGYGEVWKAHAPGGLLKAVKFVYGNLNSKRASRELRALNRIKEVRHAFLLSIERIEIVDGNLVIVMELADQSLKQHYEKQRAGGLRGIEREELLSYLRDAADALDYIYDNYSLQHLDIKPENLLLIGDRAKVADFGLIKNLYERSASLIEGLTPIYSPPELFAGKPNRHSDQYSLAIVYLEMLTGELPFDGMTAAHLANQHLHTPPDLSALPKCEQPVIARALSKQPEERFSSCRALIAALVDAGKDSTLEQVPRQGASPVVLLKTESLTEVPLPAAPTAWSRQTTKTESPGQLPSIDLGDPTSTPYGPVLFVGIGGTATRVLRRLRRRLHDRLGTMDATPAIDLVLLDTDVESLNRATEGEPGMPLHVSETMALPLRRTEDYRASAGKILGSTSRRWLYNIPFSLQTEGFRPLGRLAMVDHSRRLVDRLRQALAKITREENVATTARHTGLEFCSRQPRVYLVASISGGTGGGMVLDVAYAVRSILAELNLSEENVYGLLLHSTPRGAGDRDKAIANSYATLGELWHYCRPGHFYPGDRSCGLPAFHGNNSTFSDCYFVHLGDELTETQLDAATDPVAEYLYSSTVTPAARFFDKCRQIEHAGWGAESHEPVMRTFGLCQLGGSNSDIPATLAELLCQDLVCNWRSGIAAGTERAAPRLSETMALIAAHDKPRQSRFIELDEQAAAKVDELELRLDRMRVVAREILDQEVSCDVQLYFSKLIGDAFESPQAEADRNDVARVFAIVDAVLGDGGADDSGSETAFDSLATVLDTRLEARASKLATTVRDWIFKLVDESGAHVEGAKHAAEWFQDYLRRSEREAVAAVGHLRDQVLTFKEAVLSEQTARGGAGGRPDAKWLREAQALLSEYARLRLQQVTDCSVARWLRLVEGQVTAALDRLQQFWTDLNELAAAFHFDPALGDAANRGAAPDIVHNHWRSLLSELMRQRAQLVAALDGAVEDKFGGGRGKLQSFLAQDTDIQTQLSMPLRSAARELILKAMQGLNLSRLADGPENPSSLDSRELRRCVEAARPNQLDDSAATRLLFILPNSIDEACLRARVASENGPPISVVRVVEGDLVVCQEVERLCVRDIAARLVANRRDYIEIAGRLHTRIDVDWDDMSAGSSR